MPVVVGGLLALSGCGGESVPSTEPPPSPSASGTPAPAPTQTPVPATVLRTVEEFLEFANGTRSGAEVPWGEQVAYSIAGEPLLTLDPRTAPRRRAWDACPTGSATYEGRDCPVNVLRTLAFPAQEGSTVVIEDQAPGRVLGCSYYTAPSAEAATTVWLRPSADRRDCFTDMAVAVSVSADGRIVAVDLALSGP